MRFLDSTPISARRALVIATIAAALLLAWGLRVSQVLAPSSHKAATTHRPALVTVYGDTGHVMFACSGQLVSKGGDVTFVPHPKPRTEEAHRCSRGRAVAVLTTQYDSPTGRVTRAPVQSLQWERSHRAKVRYGAHFESERVVEYFHTRVTTDPHHYPS